MLEGDSQTPTRMINEKRYLVSYSWFRRDRTAATKVKAVADILTSCRGWWHYIAHADPVHIPASLYGAQGGGVVTNIKDVQSLVTGHPYPSARRRSVHVLQVGKVSPSIGSKANLILQIEIKPVRASVALRRKGYSPPCRVSKTRPCNIGCVASLRLARLRQSLDRNPTSQPLANLHAQHTCLGHIALDDG